MTASAPRSAMHDIHVRADRLMVFTKPSFGIVLTHASYVVAETVVLSYLAHMLRTESLQAAELQRLVEAMDRQGTIDLRESDDVVVSTAGQALSGVITRLRDTIAALTNGTQLVATAANESASDSEELADRNRTQTEALAETSSAVRQLGDIVSRNAEQARQANKLVDSAVTVAAKGGDVVSRVVTTMGDSVAAGSTLVDEAGATMTELVAGVRGIANIMDKLQASFAHETGGLQQVDQSLQKMDAMTQSNGELVRSMATTAGNLKERGEELSAAIGVFDVGNQPVHGHAAFDREETREPRHALAA